MRKAQSKTKRNEAVEPELLSLSQAAQELDVSTDFLRTNLLAEGVLPFDKSGPQPRVLRRDLENYKVERQRREKLLTQLTQETQDLGLGYDY